VTEARREKTKLQHIDPIHDYNAFMIRNSIQVKFNFILERVLPVADGWGLVIKYIIIPFFPYTPSYYHE
jgi:hypothetical protein